MKSEAKAMTTAAAAELLCDIAERLAESRGRTIIAIDGRCAGGKTTLAHAAEELLLARGIPCRTLHTDDFFLRPEQRTEQRMKTAGGNMDFERLRDEVLLPLSRGESCLCRPYRCHGVQPEPYTADGNGITLIEGAYSCRPELRRFYDRTIFIDIEHTEQAERILRRNGAERARAFAERWIPLEERYISELHPELSADKILRLVG